ncbi:MAG: hypothetical protein MK035_08290, partial [Dehalococcoidia bacterium]|nr:hypothetical protein [Dehalococcoidia bacterium]
IATFIANPNKSALIDRGRINRGDTSMRADMKNNTPTNAGLSNAEVANTLVIMATTPVHRNEIPNNPTIRRGLYPETLARADPNGAVLLVTNPPINRPILLRKYTSMAITVPICTEATRSRPGSL